MFLCVPKKRVKQCKKRFYTEGSLFLNLEKILEQKCRENKGVLIAFSTFVISKTYR